jgi:hypothetical protein
MPENKRKEGWYWVRVRDYEPFPAVWNGKTFEDANEEMLNEEDYAGPFVVVGSIPLPEELALLQRKARAWDRMEATANDVSWRHKSWAITGDVPGLVCLPVDHNGKPVPTYATALEASEAAAMREGGDA